jgi:hypothetical protein
VVSDGARDSKAGEAEIVAATRAIIDRVDWDCEVLKHYSGINLGCKLAVSSGLDWVFEQVEEAIILEDDCLPDPTFFRFCQELLERYRHDQRIGMINGDNFQFGRRRNDDSYYFSKFVHIWGWACWRDRWQSGYEVELKKWPAIRDGGWLEDMLGVSHKKELAFWRNAFEHTYQNNATACWDTQWLFANWLGGRINVTPNVNLISNIGFGQEATHTVTVNHLANMAVDKIVFPLVHPVGIVRNTPADLFNFQVNFCLPLPNRIINKLKRIAGKLRGALK